MRLNDNYDIVRGHILCVDPLLNANKAYYIVLHFIEPTTFFENNLHRISNSNVRKDIRKFRDLWEEVCQLCKGEGHTYNLCIERIGYLN